jgi:hypothetical protein
LDNAVGRVTSILCIPYGYTVSLWCAGALAVRRHGLPSALEVMLFAAGGVAGFLLLAVLGRAHLDAEVPMRVPAIVVANAFPLVTVLVILAFPLGPAGRWGSFFGASFVTTAVYIGGLATIIRLARGRRRPTR